MPFNTRSSGRTTTSTTVGNIPTTMTAAIAITPATRRCQIELLFLSTPPEVSSRRYRMTPLPVSSGTVGPSGFWECRVRVDLERSVEVSASTCVRTSSSSSAGSTDRLVRSPSTIQLLALEPCRLKLVPLIDRGSAGPRDEADEDRRSRSCLGGWLRLRLVEVE